MRGLSFLYVEQFQRSKDSIRLNGCFFGGLFVEFFSFPSLHSSIRRRRVLLLVNEASAAAAATAFFGLLTCNCPLPKSADGRMSSAACSGKILCRYGGHSRRLKCALPLKLRLTSVLLLLLCPLTTDAAVQRYIHKALTGPVGRYLLSNKDLPFDNNKKRSKQKIKGLVHIYILWLETFFRGSEVRVCYCYCFGSCQKETVLTIILCVFTTKSMR